MMKLISLLPLVILLQSCVLNDSQREKNESLNASALYDPVTVTLKEGVTYSFAEGALVGRGQKFHSDYSYRRALIIGNNK
jgi:hypothetical protein